jgi:magnesium chelatase subunit H
MKGRIRPTRIKAAAEGARRRKGTVGLLLMRSYVLAGNTGHYDGVIRRWRPRLNVVPAFAQRPRMRARPSKVLRQDGKPIVDAVLSLTGFSLVGGPAYNDAKAARGGPGDLDVPYLAAHPWSSRPWRLAGLRPRPDAGRGDHHGRHPRARRRHRPMVFGGRAPKAEAAHASLDLRSGPRMQRHPERPNPGRRIERLVRCAGADAERKVAIVLFNFPPNAGNTGTAAYLSVFESLFNTLKRMKRRGLHGRGARKRRCAARAHLNGNAAQFGAHANVLHPHPRRRSCPPRTLSRRDRGQWGPAPGAAFTDGRRSSCSASSSATSSSACSRLRLRGRPDAAAVREAASRRPTPSPPSTASCARFRRRRGAAFRHPRRARVHARQADRHVRECWPDRLIGDLPNFYLYASNNPSEGHHRQAPLRGDAGQLSDAAHRQRRALSRPADLKASSSAGALPDATAEAERSSRG